MSLRKDYVLIAPFFGGFLAVVFNRVYYPTNLKYILISFFTGYLLVFFSLLFAFLFGCNQTTFNKPKSKGVKV